MARSEHAWVTLFMFCLFLDNATSVAWADGVRDVDAWRLRNDLLGNGYDSGTRPSSHENDTTQVYLTMDVIDGPILHPDKELFYADISLCMTWVDPRLQWNQTQYGGMVYTHFKAEDIWKPMLYIVSSWSDVSSSLLSGNSKFLVESTGTAHMCSAVSVHSFCNADMTHFPMDRHECKVEYSTILDVAKDVNLTVNRTDARGKSDSEFELVFFNATSMITDYGEFGSYSSVLFRFTMARRNRFHLFTLLLPSVAVVQLGLLSLWLPPVSDRRFALSGAAFLASLLLLYRVDDAAVGSTRVPKISEPQRRLRHRAEHQRSGQRPDHRPHHRQHEPRQVPVETQPARSRRQGVQPDRHRCAPGVSSPEDDGER
ncbi:neuronal acetylcholine receptor subunit beta-3-like isoform X2 [Haemaphysalis longicornis]